VQSRDRDRRATELGRGKGESRGARIGHANDGGRSCYGGLTGWRNGTETTGKRNRRHRRNGRAWRRGRLPRAALHQQRDAHAGVGNPRGADTRQGQDEHCRQGERARNFAGATTPRTPCRAGQDRPDTKGTGSATVGSTGSSLVMRSVGLGIHATIRIPPTAPSSIPMKNPPRFTPTRE